MSGPALRKMILEGRFEVRRPRFGLGEPQFLVGGLNLSEALRDLWPLPVDGELGTCRVTIERLDAAQPVCGAQ